MTMKKDAKRKTRKKLTLNKETIRDLNPRERADTVKGGVTRSHGASAFYTCT